MTSTNPQQTTSDMNPQPVAPHAAFEQPGAGGANTHFPSHVIGTHPGTQQGQPGMAQQQQFQQSFAPQGQQQVPQSFAPQGQQSVHPGVGATSAPQMGTGPIGMGPGVGSGIPGAPQVASGALGGTGHPGMATGAAGIAGGAVAAEAAHHHGHHGHHHQQGAAGMTGTQAGQGVAQTGAGSQGFVASHPGMATGGAAVAGSAVAAEAMHHHEQHGHPQCQQCQAECQQCQAGATGTQAGAGGMPAGPGSQSFVASHPGLATGGAGLAGGAVAGEAMHHHNHHGRHHHGAQAGAGNQSLGTQAGPGTQGGVASHPGMATGAAGVAGGAVAAEAMHRHEHHGRHHHGAQAGTGDQGLGTQVERHSVLAPHPGAAGAAGLAGVGTAENVVHRHEGAGTGAHGERFQDGTSASGATGTGTYGATGTGTGATVGRGVGAGAGGVGNPLNVQPVPEGGVAIGGQQGLPMGKPSTGDKIMGKVEQHMGKLVGDHELATKGELRAVGGKAAAAGEARAPIQNLSASSGL